ncbi:Uncharacterised protein [Streptococcus pneumoniae]|nr:Uncharacterised protein [Streptococcus pneumoniae]
MATFPIDNLKLINKVPLGEMSIFFDFNANLEIDSLVLVTLKLTRLANLIYLHASGISYIG